MSKMVCVGHVVILSLIINELFYITFSKSSVPGVYLYYSMSQFGKVTVQGVTCGHCIG